MYSLAHILSILEQEAREGIILQPRNSSTLYGSVLNPPSIEREELRVYHFLLLLVFFFVLCSCPILFVGIYKV